MSWFFLNLAMFQEKVGDIEKIWNIAKFRKNPRQIWLSPNLPLRKILYMDTATNQIVQGVSIFFMDTWKFLNIVIFLYIQQWLACRLDKSTKINIVKCFEKYRSDKKILCSLNYLKRIGYYLDSSRCLFFSPDSFWDIEKILNIAKFRKQIWDSIWIVQGLCFFFSDFFWIVFGDIEKWNPDTSSTWTG